MSSSVRPVLSPPSPFVLLLFLLLLGLSSSPFPSVSAKASSDGGKALYCALCEVVVDEVDAAIARTAEEHGHTVQTKWRIDEKRRIPYARTEHRLLEIIEDEVKASLPHYGSCNHTDRIRLLRQFSAPQLPTVPLVASSQAEAAGDSSDGGLGLADVYSPTQFNHSPVLTSTLVSLYERLVDVHLEEMLLLFHKDEADIKAKLCVKKVRACNKGTTFDAFTPPQRAKREAVVEQKEGGGGGGGGEGTPPSTVSTPAEGQPPVAAAPAPATAAPILDQSPSHHSDL